MKIVLVIILTLTASLRLNAQQPCVNSSLHYRYLFPDSAYIVKQINTAEGGRLLLGYAYSGVYDGSFVLRFNSDGTLKWGKRITDKKILSTYFIAIAEASNGNIIVTGRYVSGDTYHDAFAIVALSPNGDLINQQTIVDFGDNEFDDVNILSSQMIAKPGLARNAGR